MENNSAFVDQLELPLDSSLHIWVLLPIALATLLVAVLRRNLVPVFLSEPATHPTKLVASSSLTRSILLRRNGSYLPWKQFEVRRQYLVRENGPLDVSTDPQAAISVLMNPDVLANQAVSIAISIIPQMLLGQWASSSFAGLVVCRLPFSLTPRFRSMLHSGIEFIGRDLDVSYVSSLSWYVLNIFGVSGILTLFSDAQDDDLPFIPAGPAQISNSINPNKAYSTERETLTSFRHQFNMDEEQEKFLSIVIDRFKVY